MQTNDRNKTDASTIALFADFWMSPQSHARLDSLCEALLTAEGAPQKAMYRQLLIYAGSIAFEQCDHAGVSIKDWCDGRFGERQLSLDIDNDNEPGHSTEVAA